MKATTQTLSPALNKTGFIMTGFRAEPLSFLNQLCKEQSLSEEMLSRLKMLQEQETRRAQQKILDSFLREYQYHNGFYDELEKKNFDAFYFHYCEKNDPYANICVYCETQAAADLKIQIGTKYTTKTVVTGVNNRILHFVNTTYEFSHDNSYFGFKSISPNGESMFNWSCKACEDNRNKALYLLGWGGIWHNNLVRTEEEAGMKNEPHRDKVLER